MNQQRVIGFIVALVVLIGVIAALNHYYFQPKVLLTMPGVERVKVPAKTAPSFKSDLYAGTMEQILASKDVQDLLPQVTAIVKRNPFLWPSETTEPGALQAGVCGGGIAGNTPGVSSQQMTYPPGMEGVPGSGTAQDFLSPEFNLSMVIVGETRNLALVNNQFVTEGNRISGYKVVKIEPGMIILAGKNDRQKVTLEPGGPLQYPGTLKKKKSSENDAPGTGESALLDFETQLKDVIRLYSSPNLLLQ
ncbi:MAG: hypothetical protein RBR67_14305 [Desulfobacterium sp.]|nr:hypothetical protein [Desulfobacterium sp.]